MTSIRILHDLDDLFPFFNNVVIGRLPRGVFEPSLESLFQALEAFPDESSARVVLAGRGASEGTSWTLADKASFV